MRILKFVVITFLLGGISVQTTHGQAALGKAVPVLGKALRAIGQLFTSNPKAIGIGAAMLAAAGGTAAFQRHLAQGEAVYALEFDLNNNVSSIYWADYFSKPDVFPVLQVAGKGTHLIPDLVSNYAGGKIVWTFKIPKIPADRTVSIILEDDDSFSNQVWNSILATRWTVSLKTVILMEAVPLSANASGSLQFLNTPMTIDAPDQLCVYSIKTPSSDWGGVWDSSGELKDGAGTTVGHVKFSQLISR